jgi:hypothetical protein
LCPARLCQNPRRGDQLRWPALRRPGIQHGSSSSGSLSRSATGPDQRVREFPRRAGAHPETAQPDVAGIPTCELQDPFGTRRYSVEHRGNPSLIGIFELLGAHIHEVRRLGKPAGLSPYGQSSTCTARSTAPCFWPAQPPNSTQPYSTANRPVLRRSRSSSAPPQRRAASFTPPTMVAPPHAYNRPWSLLARTFVPRTRHRPRTHMFFSPVGISRAFARTSA